MPDYNPKILISAEIATPTLPQVPFETTNWAGTIDTVPAPNRMGWVTTDFENSDDGTTPHSFGAVLKTNEWD